MHSHDLERQEKQRKRLQRIRETPLDCWRKSTQETVYRLYLNGVDMETISEQVQHLTHENIDPDEISHIIDKLNEIYL
jgi:hypothetical protein